MRHAQDTRAGEPTERWGALGAVLLATFYLWLLAWLVAFVAVPAVGLRWQPIVITSGSMEPLIRPGDVVLTERPDDPHDLGPGTVITFDDPARPGTLTTHRILGVTPTGSYRTQGDANASADSTPVPPENVAGVGRLLVPLIGLPLLWVRGAIGLFALWLLVTAGAVAVAMRQDGAGADQDEGPRDGESRGDGDSDGNGARRPRVLVGASAALRTVVRTFAMEWRCQVLRLAGAVLAVRRPLPSPLRAAAPSLAILGVTGLIGSRPWHLVVAAGSLALAIALDPAGPELRVGRWSRTARRMAAHVQPAIQRCKDLTPDGAGMLLRPAAILLVLALAGSSLGERSAAAFNGTVAATGSVAADSTFDDGSTTTSETGEATGEAPAP